MFAAFIAIGSIGLVAGIGLALASKIFYVHVDPKIVAVEEALPGANCGGCGFPGCSGAAAAIATGGAPPNICVGGGADVHVKVAGILGVEVQETEPQFAKPGCWYGTEEADLKYVYDGFNDCRAALLLDGGSKQCSIGCLGLGTCVKACPFGALTMGPDHLPEVNKALCTGCGTCERVCPKHIITLTSNSTRIQREYTTDQCTAPCQRACPAGIDIPAYVGAIAEGEYLEAVRIIKETNPFPSVCGRICVHPCESECRRNLVDEGIAINPLKRFAADFERTQGERVQVPRAPETGKRIAVVGGGAEGLTAAYFLNRLGHDVTVYEAKPVLGGLLRTGLPENRLPRYVLDWEIQGILQAGVEAITDQKLGRDSTVDSLLEQGYSAVFVATGGWDTQLAQRTEEGIPEPLPGVRLLIDYMISQREGKPFLSMGRNIMILGGGKAALEAASASIEQGAEAVHMVFRASRDRIPFSEEELSHAEKQGIHLYFQSALTKMMGQEKNLTHVEITPLTGAGDEIQDGKTVVPMDTLLIGAGRFPELIYASQKTNVEEPDSDVVKWETLAPYAGPFAEEDIGIFRPGEATGDYKAVVEAIGSGRRAAGSVQKFLTGRPIEAPPKMIRKLTQVVSLDEVEPLSHAPRQQEPERSEEERIADPSAEIVLGFSEEQALSEARRCLRCGLICYRRIRQKGMMPE